MDNKTTDITAIPLSWMYDYWDSLAERPTVQVAISEMLIKFFKEQEKAQGE